MTRVPFPKITISGDLGSGKSAIARLLGDRTGYRLCSTGEMQRQIAARHGMTTLELNRYSETHPEIDDEIDSASVALRHQPESVIVDSRIAWNFIPESFKVCLVVDPKIGAQRIFGGERRQGESYADLTAAISDVRQRRASERQRFRHKYGIDLADPDNFDLVVDTSWSTPGEIAEVISDAWRAWSCEASFRKYWLPPRLLLPTREEEAPEALLEVARYGDFYFILRGHAIASTALREGVSLLPAEILIWDRDLAGPEAEASLRGHHNPALVAAWERRHDFRFPAWPAP